MSQKNLAHDFRDALSWSRLFCKYFNLLLTYLDFVGYERLPQVVGLCLRQSKCVWVCHYWLLPCISLTKPEVHLWFSECMAALPEQKFFELFVQWFTCKKSPCNIWLYCASCICSTEASDGALICTLGTLSCLSLNIGFLTLLYIA